MIRRLEGRVVAAVVLLAALALGPGEVTPATTAGEAGPALVPAVLSDQLNERGHVVTDDFGVPHVFAQNAHDLYFMTGFVQARDRLFQMDVTRRQASGTLAELLGPDALASDVQLRTLGLRRAAKRSREAISDDARRELAAYADGVNAFIERAESKGQLPPAYGALELTQVEPWTVVDTLTVAKALAFRLSFDGFETELTRAFLGYSEALRGTGIDGATLFNQDLFRSEPVNETTVLAQNDGTRTRRQLDRATGDPLASPVVDDSPIDESTRELLGDYLDDVRDVPMFEPLLRQRAVGSNWFVVSGEHAASGHPLLANDPHLSLTNPSVFYEMDHKIAGGEALSASGVAFPGVPYVVLGQTDSIAWGATNNPIDETDFFQEQIVRDEQGRLHTVFRGEPEPVTVIPEEFKANQVGDDRPNNVTTVPPGDQVPRATLVAPRHGPIVQMDREAGEAISVQFTGFYDTREVETFRAWNRADNLDDFKAGLKTFDFGSQNWAYADTEGNIAYFSSGEVPLRQDLQQGFVDLVPPYLVRNGTGSLQHEWIRDDDPDPEQAIPFETLPFAAMPQSVNPAKGFLVSANNDPLGHTLDNDPFNQRRPSGDGLFYLTRSYSSGFRAGRLTELIRGEIEGDGTVSVADAKGFMADIKQLSARRLVPHLVDALDAALSDEAPQPLAQFAQDPRLSRIRDLLASWDYSTPTGLASGYGDGKPAGQAPTEREVSASVAATIANVWISELTSNTVDAALNAISPQLPKPPSSGVIRALVHQLETFDQNRGVGASGLPLFDVPEMEAPAPLERDMVLLASLRDALRALSGDAFASAFDHSEELRDYRWGKLHRITFNHVAQLGGPFRLPQDGSFPVDGAFNVVDASSFNIRADAPADFHFGSGPSRRTISVLDPSGIRTHQVIPGGQSGSPGTDHYGDQLPLWLTNRFHPLFTDPVTVVDNGATWQDFVPAPGAQ